jgi:hypothetical protein
MPRIQAWGDAQLQEALALAAQTSLREAARQTGIPFGTLARHQAKARQLSGAAQPAGAKQGATRPANGTKHQKTPRAALDVRDAVMEKAIDQAAAAVADKVTAMAEELQRVAGRAWERVAAMIEAEAAGEKLDAAAVRALVGVVAQGIEKSQLLIGRPTGRQVVEGSVTHQQDVGALLADPEALQLARLLYRRQSPAETPAVQSPAELEPEEQPAAPEAPIN